MKRNNKTIYCAKCAGEITNKEDLVITNNILTIVPYHGECFSKELKGVSTILVGNDYFAHMDPLIRS